MTRLATLARQQLQLAREELLAGVAGAVSAAALRRVLAHLDAAAATLDQLECDPPLASEIRRRR